MQVLIVGLGLIGGSVAKALKKNSDWYIVGCDTDKSVLDDALSSSAVDSAWDSGTESSADLTVICLSPKNTVGFLRKNVEFLKKGSVVTDVCGVKGSIVGKCTEICTSHKLFYVGGHPMAGKERGGFKNSDENLFNRASYILTPINGTDMKAVETVKEFIYTLNAARVTVTDPETHDRIIAFTSQIPHIIAGAYVKSPSCKARKGFSAGSFKDVSRVASIDENMWSELFLLNKDKLLPELDSLIFSLNEYRTALADGDAEKLITVIKNGRIIKENDNKEPMEEHH